MTSDVGPLLEVELERRNALIHADAEALERLLAPDFRYVHATGRVEDRQSYIQSVASRKNLFRRFADSELSSVVSQTVGAMTGNLTVTVEIGGEEQDRFFRFSAIWLQTDSGWQLAYWQSTSAPA